MVTLTQPDCCALIQKNQAILTNQGMTSDPNVAIAIAAAAIMFLQIMQQEGAFKKCIFSTCPNFTKLCLRHMVMNLYVLYL